MSDTRRCGHDRYGQDVERCPLCAMRINPAAYWLLVRELNQWRKTRRRKAGGATS